MRTMLRASRMLLALMATALVACDGGDPFSTSDAAQNGTFEQFESNVLESARSSGLDPEAGASTEQTIYRSEGGNGGWTFVQGTAGDVAVEAVIGSRGGVLNLGNHWLLVPENAVKGEVRFRMQPISDGTFHVDLTATQVRRRGDEKTNDVGHNGFRKPVYLGYHYAGLPVDPTRLGVAWLTDGGLVGMPTFLHEDAWVVGELRHFSGYVLVAN